MYNILYPVKIMKEGVLCVCAELTVLRLTDRSDRTIKPMFTISKTGGIWNMNFFELHHCGSGATVEYGSRCAFEIGRTV